MEEALALAVEIETLVKAAGTATPKDFNIKMKLLLLRAAALEMTSTVLQVGWTRPTPYP